MDPDYIPSLILPNLLQEFFFIPLDIFRNYQHNNGINNKLEAWLTFLSIDSPEIIIQLLEAYPEFKEMYEEVYAICLNTERVMSMFSKELLELDKNTVQYMIDEMQDELDAKQETINAHENTISTQQETISAQQELLEQNQQEIATLKKMLAEAAK